MRKKISRRNLLKLGLYSAAGMNLAQFSILNGCGGQQPKNSQLSEFSQETYGFDVYNNRNKNLSSQWNTFHDSIVSGSTPGLDYRTGAPMVAVAKGIVSQIQYLTKSPGGGEMVTVNHPPHYSSYYAHLDIVNVKRFDYVERGQKIGHPSDKRIAKLMLMEDQTWVDPDNYGINHSYMDFWDKKTNLGIGKEEQDRRLKKQISLTWDDFLEGFTDYEKYDLIWKKHKRKNRDFGYKITHFNWSRIERYRFLEYLYALKPDMFPNLTEERVKAITKEFYQNQPIILSAPF